MSQSLRVSRQVDSTEREQAMGLLETFTGGRPELMFIESEVPYEATVVPEAPVSDFGDIEVLIDSKTVEEAGDLKAGNLPETGKAVYEEGIHSLQLEGFLSDERSGDEVFSPLEEEYVRPLHEGQAKYNLGEGIDEIELDESRLYSEFLDRAEDMSAGEALESVSEDFALYEAQLSIKDAGAEEFLMVERGGESSDTYEEAESCMFGYYGADAVCGEMDLNEIDYRDDGIDSSKLGEHLLRTQEKIEEGFGRTQQNGYAVPEKNKTPAEMI